jgi:post-segregation antitoxin (ccd killing protein)
MLVRMTRLTITVPDDLANLIRQAGGDNVSAWAARRLREALVREEAQAIAEYERTHRDPEWDAERESMA